MPWIAPATDGQRLHIFRPNTFQTLTEKFILRRTAGAQDEGRKAAEESGVEESKRPSSSFRSC